MFADRDRSARRHRLPLLSRRPKAPAALAVLLLIGVGTACSSDPGSTSNSAGSGASTSAAVKACVQKATALADKYSQSPDYTQAALPGPVSQVKGKTIWIIGSSIYPGVPGAISGIKQAVSLLGLNLKVFDDKSEAALDNQALEDAASTHAAGIILDSVALETASEGLAAAKAAHIPIVSMYPEATDASESAAVKGFVVPNSMDQAQAMLGPLLENVGCHGQIGYLYGSVFALQLQMLQDAKVVISQLCRGVSDCGMKPYSFDLDNYTTTASPASIALAHTTPGLSSIFILGDFIAAYLVPAFHTADIKIPIATTGGSELDLLTQPWHAGPPRRRHSVLSVRRMGGFGLSPSSDARRHGACAESDLRSVPAPGQVCEGRARHADPQRLSAALQDGLEGWLTLFWICAIRGGLELSQSAPGVLSDCVCWAASPRSRRLPGWLPVPHPRVVRRVHVVRAAVSRSLPFEF